MYRFDNEQKEIHFDKYNTPTPWMNYLSNGVFHTMISHCGGGVAFYKSPHPDSAYFYVCNQKDATFHSIAPDESSFAVGGCRILHNPSDTCALLQNS